LLACWFTETSILTDIFYPNSHLLEKIQALGKKSLDEKKQKIDGTVVPPPIKRRLLV
jgi:hypothetical protein